MSCVYRTVQSFGYKFWDFAIFNRESFIFKVDILGMELQFSKIKCFQFMACECLLLGLN